MQYRFKKEGGILYVQTEGEIDMSMCDEWRDAIDNELGRSGLRNIVFDVTSVSFIDSSGLGVILGRYRKLLARGGKVAVKGANEQVYKILLLSGLAKIMEVSPACKQAVNRVGGIL
ncbi:MAG: anti-sigma factor antagonist [Clostridia bacterium]|jgi:stage II sporulation protein AA (anti-sigma F factor antagonist)|nr:anti-sigma factor antagonist [Clostridia bacterium]